MPRIFKEGNDTTWPETKHLSCILFTKSSGCGHLQIESNTTAKQTFNMSVKIISVFFTAFTCLNIHYLTLLSSVHTMYCQKVRWLLNKEMNTGICLQELRTTMKSLNWTVMVTAKIQTVNFINTSQLHYQFCQLAQSKFYKLVITEGIQREVEVLPGW